MPAAPRDLSTHAAVSAPSVPPFEYKLDGLRAWVGKEQDPVVKAVKEKVVKNFAMVSDEAFEAACRDAAHCVARALEHVEPHKIMVLKSNAPESSNGWVFERCGDPIVREGTACSYFLGGWEKMKGYPTLSQAVLREGRTHFVVFDDVSYSGTQITQRWLNHVADFARKNPGVQLEVFYVCGFATTSSEEVISKGARQNPSLLRKRNLGRSSIFGTWKNPRCISADTRPVFPRTKNRISTQPPLSRYG